MSRSGPTHLELARAGAIIRAAERRQDMAIAADNRATLGYTTGFVAVFVIFGVIFGVFFLLDGEFAESTKAPVTGAICGAAFGGAMSMITPRSSDPGRYTPSEVADLVGYVLMVEDTGYVLTPLGECAVEAHETWPEPLNPPLEPGVAAWLP